MRRHVILLTLATLCAAVHATMHVVDVADFDAGRNTNGWAISAQGWLSPYVQKGVTGEYTFTQEIKDIIMFEYHDINNANALPMTDIIFARDVLSLIAPEGQKTVLADFEEKLKGNGVLVLGENESGGSGMSWGEKTQGSLTYYNKQ